MTRFARGLRVAVDAETGAVQGLGLPIKIHFSWICKEKTAKRKSKYHAKGEVYHESGTTVTASFAANLRAIGKSIRAHYKSIKEPYVRVKLQIDSAGEHGLAAATGTSSYSRP
jgi:hypothetical protein